MLTRFSLAACLLLSYLSITGQSRPIGVNLMDMADWSPQLLFVDAMKQCRPWIVADTNIATWQINDIPVPQRSDGYPTKVPFDYEGNDYLVHTLLNREHTFLYPGGTYHLRFKGSGRVQVNFDAENTIFSVPNELHAFEVTPSNGGIHLTIKESDSLDPVHDIQVIMPGFEESFEQHDFHPEVLDLLDSFQSIRYMPAQATNVTQLEDPEDRTTEKYYTQQNVPGGGMAYEYIAKLSNETKTDPWICIPHRASDELVREVAQMMYDQVDSSLTVIVEYGNEFWNGAYPYAVAQNYAQERGLALGFSENAYQAMLRWVSYRSLQIFKIFDEVFAGAPQRLQTVLASQGANPWTGMTMLEALHMDTINPADQKVDIIAIAPYFGGNIGDQLIDSNWIDTISVETILDKVADQLVEPDYITQWIREYKELADEYGVQLYAYEGGQHMVGVRHINDERLTPKLIEANRHPRMQELYCQYYDIWYENGGELFATFLFMGNYSKYGSWGLFEHLGQDPLTAPKWMALRQCVFEDPTSRVGEIERINGISIFPNPVEDHVNVWSEEEPIDQIMLFDLNGKLVFREKTNRMTSAQISLSGMTEGMYIMQITSSRGKIMYTRIIKD